jgi:hypothetical protein
MAMFNSYVKLPEGSHLLVDIYGYGKLGLLMEELTNRLMAKSWMWWTQEFLPSPVMVG